MDNTFQFKITARATSGYPVTSPSERILFHLLWKCQLEACSRCGNDIPTRSDTKLRRRHRRSSVMLIFQQKWRKLLNIRGIKTHRYMRRATLHWMTLRTQRLTLFLSPSGGLTHKEIDDQNNQIAVAVKIIKCQACNVQRLTYSLLSLTFCVLHKYVRRKPWVFLENLGLHLFLGEALKGC